ncbi:MAG: tRNA (guanosine(37)-N1)-methyltransferase TrmD [Coriobacteriia bacterium]|nr:tRNA (guanosine(37)-N1)-methyltransferase TrmD [Coriobacteriia bacterium]
MRIDVVTMFPEVVSCPMSASMVGLAQERGVLELSVHDLRQWAEGVHRQVDDYPYGGGPGMVVKPEPVFRAVRALGELDAREPVVVLLTPQGRLLDQRLVEDLAGKERLLLVCGRYEGFDERVRSLADFQVSIGDYVLTGGELPAMVLIDAVTRLLPGVLGHEDSSAEESFSWGLLEYPQYTRPAEFEGMQVPDVLLSGDHARIAKWRRDRAVERTARQRPDLLERADLTDDERLLARRVLDEAAEDPE